MRMTRETYQMKYSDFIEEMKSFSKLEQESAKDLKEYLNNHYGYTSRVFKKRLMNFLKYGCLSVQEMNSLINICTKIKRYENEIGKGDNLLKGRKKRSKKELDKIIEFIEEYIKSGKTLSEYLKTMNRNRRDFKFHLDIIKDYNYLLYKKCYNYILNQETEIHNSIVTLVPEMVQEMKMGIDLEDGTKREFDIIDYYMKTKIPIQEFLERAREESFSSDVLRYLGTFCRGEEDYKLTDKEILDFLNFDTELLCDHDEKGFPIKNTGIIIPEEDKIELLYTLEQYHIPLTRRVKAAAINRYKNGYPMKQETQKSYRK